MYGSCSRTCFHIWQLLVDMLPCMAAAWRQAPLYGSCIEACSLIWQLHRGISLIWQLHEGMLPYMAAAHRQGGGRGNGSKRSGKGERDQDPGKPSLSWRNRRGSTLLMAQWPSPGDLIAISSHHDLIAISVMSSPSLRSFTLRGLHGQVQCSHQCSAVIFVTKSLCTSTTA